MSKSSGSQLYIKIISILNLIGGAFYILIGIIGFFGKPQPLQPSMFS